jgi:hypothetical protein
MHLAFQKFFARSARREYARGYRAVRVLRMTYITRTQMIERKRDADAAIVHCEWHDCGPADANGAAMNSGRHGSAMVPAITP